MFDGFVSTFRAVNPLEKTPLTYRIILIDSTKSTYILAVSDSLEVIETHWSTLVEEILPNIYAKRDNSASPTNSMYIERKKVKEKTKKHYVWFSC